jgi:hypothetical protein
LYRHRLVTNAPPAAEVHHANGDPGDNRLGNLRIVSHAEHVWLQPRNVGAERGLLARDDAHHHGRHIAAVAWRGRRVWRYAFRSNLLSAFMRDNLARRLTGRDDGLNFSKSVEQRHIRALFEAHPGEAIGVIFVRRGDAAIRSMRCRAPEESLLTGMKMRFNPARRQLLSVFDLDRQEHRFIPPGERPMPYLARRADPGPPRPSLTAYVNRFGDLVCPYCETNIITPAFCRVVAGRGRCPRCHQVFRVTADAAEYANELAARNRKS